ncbi:MAG: T9SS type A sorting domain-containing protein [Bacteroidia bacterium]|nr:T9SS type A sorting domain-containing protein [Bacteroidia bacterium]
MKNHKLFLLLLTFFYLNIQPTFSQKYDNTWLMGYYYSSFTNVTGLDFYFGNPVSVGFAPPFNFFSTGGACMSDANGDLLFYTNGCQVANFNNQLLPNSNLFNNYAPQNYTSVCDLWQSVISLPYPDQPGKFILMHYNYYTGSAPYGVSRLFYSVVDMNANGGTGEMTTKNMQVFQDSLIDSFLHATKHANGRDWWVITHQRSTNAFHLTLVTPAGPTQHFVQNTGPAVPRFDIGEGQAEFSPDGSMFGFVHNRFNSFYLFDFDRCSGTISFRDSVHITQSNPNEWPLWGGTFSPNSQYFYANTQKRILQYDVLAPSLAASEKLVGVDDGTGNPIFRPRPGPNGKLYYIGWGSETNLSVINNPDLADTLCDFQQHSVQLTSYHGTSIPDFPNYRLGPLTGSSCDTLTPINELLDDSYYDITISPNPNNGIFNISYGLQADRSGKLRVLDINGKEVYLRSLPIYSISQQMKLDFLASGIYYLQIVSGKNSESKKFVVVRED